MWIFYHDITSASTAGVASDTGVFTAVVVLLALVILAPSYFENRRK